MEKAEEEANTSMKGANKKAGGYGKAGISSPKEACSLGAVHGPAQVTQAEIARRQAVAVLLDNKRSRAQAMQRHPLFLSSPGTSLRVDRQALMAVAAKANPKKQTKKTEVGPESDSKCCRNQ